MFIAGVIMGQLVGLNLRPAGSDEDSYLLMLAAGQLTMQASSLLVCLQWQVCPATNLPVTAPGVACLMY